MEKGFVGALAGWFWVAELFVISLVLQFGMLPLMARDLHRVPLVGPIANLLVVPLTGLIVPLGFFSLGASFVLPAAGKLLAMPLAWLLAIQGTRRRPTIHFPGSAYRVPGPSMGVLILFFSSAALLAVGHRMIQERRRWVTGVAIVGVLIAAALIITYPSPPQVMANHLEVTVLDVAQGDSILVVSPRGSTLLIDGGGACEGFPGRPEHLGVNPGEAAVSAYLWSRGFKSLNAVALTHAHQDHVGGLNAVLQNFRVGRVWRGKENASPALAHFNPTAGLVHVQIEHELRGQSLLWDGVQVDFPWTDSAANEAANVAKNNDSPVVRLKYSDRTILPPGDAEKQAEYAMLGANDAVGLHADVLKIGHHGSTTRPSRSFWRRWYRRSGLFPQGRRIPTGIPVRSCWVGCRRHEYAYCARTSREQYRYGQMGRIYM
jgi:competence protein ComEC